MSLPLKKTILAIFIMSGGLRLPAPGQQVDPFYLNILKAGKAAYAAQDYREAIKNLEVAAFGLRPDNRLAAEAHILLSLSYAFTGDKAKGQKALSLALDLLGEEGLDSLSLDETIRMSLEKVYGSEQDSKGSAPPLNEGKAVSPLPSESLEEQGRPATRGELERRLKSEPHNVSLYYGLYGIYRRQRDLKAATKILSLLIQNNPEESSAYYLLAKTEFSHKEYGKALKYFNLALNPTAGNISGFHYELQSRLYTGICLYRLKMKDHAAATLKTVQEEFSEDEIASKLREEGLEKTWLLMKKELSQKN